MDLMTPPLTILMTAIKAASMLCSSCFGRRISLHQFSNPLRGRVRAVVMLLVAVVIANGRPPEGHALDIEFKGRAIKRDILVLYDRRQEGAVQLTRAHRFAQMPLNHMGYKLTYIDVNQPLPDVETLSRFRGVMSWFNEPLENPDELARWLDRATANGLRYVIMGEIVPAATHKAQPAINAILGRLGLRSTGGYVTLTYKSRVANMEKGVIGFERPIDKVLPNFPIIMQSGTSAQVHLSVRTPVEGRDVNAVLVASNAHGGYAAQNYTFTYDANTDRIGWILNPFEFFKTAFGNERFPIPDTTTLAGRRIYFSHIDGDGWNNLSEIEVYRLKQKLSAQVIAREAIEAYPDLPVSVALLAADINLRLGGNPKGRPVAKRLFALPQVEVASHTYTHPYDWQFFANYDRAVEVNKIERFQRPDTPLRQKLNAVMLRLANKKVPADRFNKYVAGTDDLPRTYLKDPFDLKTEVGRALAMSQSLAPPGKKVKLYQWSGDTTPFPAAIRATRKAGVKNLNGGDSRYDFEYPSAGYVPPIARMTGGQRQIYAVNSNENTYTNDWTGPYFGLFMLEHTLNNTERPRRLKAFNLYYHMYSGEKASALAAVKYFLNMARNGNVIPIFASHYAAIADDFFNVELEQIDLGSWAVKARGAMQTVRFDKAEGLDVDYARSSGVLGASRHEGALYVALDRAVTRALITLQPRHKHGETWAAQLGNSTVATLVNSRWNIYNKVHEVCGFTVNATGFGSGDMVWRTAPKRGFTIKAMRAGVVLNVETHWADENGLLKLKLPLSAIKPLRLRFSCHE